MESSSRPVAIEVDVAEAEPGSGVGLHARARGIDGEQVVQLAGEHERQRIVAQPQGEERLQPDVLPQPSRVHLAADEQLGEVVVQGRPGAHAVGHDLKILRTGVGRENGDEGAGNHEDRKRSSHGTSARGVLGSQSMPDGKHDTRPPPTCARLGAILPYGPMDPTPDAWATRVKEEP